MSSKLAYPEVQISRLFNSATGNFNALFPDFMDVILVYGDSAPEIISGVQLSHRPPMKHDIDEDGERLYPMELSDKRDKSIPGFFSSALTPAGLASFRDAERIFRERNSATRAYCVTWLYNCAFITYFEGCFVYSGRRSL